MAKGGRGRGGRRLDNRGTFSSGAPPTTSASNDRRRRRGPPAIFITCEVGRERRCQREAIELIHHYYYNNNVKAAVLSSSSSPAEIYDASLTTNETKLPDEDGSMQQQQQQQQIMQEEEEPTLSLEEELAMLRKGAAPEEVLSYFGNNINTNNNHNNNSKRSQHTSTTTGICTLQQVKRQKMNSSSMKSPFIVYDTGMRGTVCIVCTIPQCELIPYGDILSTLRMLNNNNKDENNNGKCESTTDLTTTSVGVVVNRSSILQDESKSILTPPLLWDPVETVRCIFHDTKKNATTTPDDTDIKNDTDANTNLTITNTNQGERSSTIGMMNVIPGSRYITRMIPIQATCYASIDEIKAVSISLLQRFLPNIYQSKRQEKDTNATTVISITFKIEIKKRLCTHLTQEELIHAIAPVLLLGRHDESGVMDAAEEGDGSLLVLPPKCKFEVSLTDPDFSIRIETCKTLCGVSILPRNDWYKKFNLAELTSPTTKAEQNKEEEEINEKLDNKK